MNKKDLLHYEHCTKCKTKRFFQSTKSFSDYYGHRACINCNNWQSWEQLNKSPTHGGLKNEY